jgi:hypothetical protein
MSSAIGQEVEDQLFDILTLTNQEFHNPITFNQNIAQIVQLVSTHGKDILNGCYEPVSLTSLQFLALLPNVSSKLIGALINLGAEINATDRNGNTIFHILAQKNNGEIIRSVIAHYFLYMQAMDLEFADIKRLLHLCLNTHNAAGDTALHCIVKSYSMMNMIDYSLLGFRELLISGASLEITNNNEDSALSLLTASCQLFVNQSMNADRETKRVVEQFNTHVDELVGHYRDYQANHKFSPSVKIASFLEEVDDYKKIRHSLKCAQRIKIEAPLPPVVKKLAQKSYVKSAVEVTNVHILSRFPDVTPENNVRRNVK